MMRYHFSNNAFENISENLKLMAHNKEPAKQLLKNFSNGVMSQLYISGVGCGKSYVAETIINCMFQARVLYIVPKLSIVDYLCKEAGFKKYNDRLSFITYNNFTDTCTAERIVSGYDLIICDEAHHIGSDIYGKAFQSVISAREKYVLGLTATPVRDADKVDVSAFYERVVTGMTNFDAIERGLMPKFEYLVCTPEIDKNTAKAHRIRTEINYENSESFLKDILHDNTRDKWICFFNDVKSLEEKIPYVQRLFPEYEIFILHSKLNNLHTVLDGFRLAERAIILCCDMILEGIHVKTDGIIIFRGVRSLTVFQQMLGRTCSINKEEIPIIIDCTETALQLFSKLMMREGYMSVGQFQAGKAHPLMQVSLCNSKYYNIMKLLYKVQEGYFFVYCDEKWDAYYSLASDYYKENGNLLIPASWEKDDMKVGIWIQNMRSAKKSGVYGYRLSEERIRRLDEIGMIWDALDEQFQQRYELAKLYKEEHGHINIPLRYETCGIKLGNWLSTCRRNYKAGKLSEPRIKMLEELGIVWDASKHNVWDKNFLYAKSYYEEYGNLYVSQNYITPDGFRLGNWISQQRANRKNGTRPMDERQISLLDSIGMIWDSNADERFCMICKKLKEYKEIHGNINVPAGYQCEDGTNLGDILWNYRTSYKRGKLSMEKVRALEDLGVIWSFAR